MTDTHQADSETRGAFGGVHKTVLLHEATDGLALKAGDVFLDCTINGGGHSEHVAKAFGKDVKIVGLDVDRDALERSRRKLEKAGADFALVQENFRRLDQALEKAGAIRAREKGSAPVPTADAILFDLGWSSDQFELSGRGFSFQKDEPLVMTLSSEMGELSAKDLLNGSSEEALADIIYAYGEERFARRIARIIVAERETRPIESTAQLVDIIGRAVPAFYRNARLHPATKTFQALRIAVNDELGALQEGLAKAYEALASGGRMAVISFHSIEDRIVKHFMREKAEEKEGEEIEEGKEGRRDQRKSLAELITKKPIVASKEELAENPRSRSAKLRILQKNIS